MSFNRRNKKGFTLIEVVAVIAIIAILGSIIAVSIVAVMKNAEKKTVTTKLTSYWKITSTAFNQINKKFATVTSPSETFLSTRLPLEKNQIKLGKKECTKIDKDESIFIQYNENPKSASNKYTLVCIWVRYKDKYYYTLDGKSVSGPKDAP